MSINSLSSISIQQRLADLKETAELSDLGIHSKDTSATCVKTILIIYTKARHECYIDYMEGIKLLLNYLKPIEVPEHILNKANLIDSSAHLPTYLINYETTELAKLLTNYTANKSLKDIRLMEKIIVLTALDNIGVTIA